MTGGTDGAPGPTTEDLGRAHGEALQIDRKLLEFLVCPVTRGPLAYDSKRQELISRAANLAFPIQNGIPLMLVDAARMLED
jgi:uncharacterized protein